MKENKKMLLGMLITVLLLCTIIVGYYVNLDKYDKSQIHSFDGVVTDCTRFVYRGYLGLITDISYTVCVDSTDGTCRVKSDIPYNVGTLTTVYTDDVNYSFSQSGVVQLSCGGNLLVFALIILCTIFFLQSVRFNINRCME